MVLNLNAGQRRQAGDSSQSSVLKQEDNTKNMLQTTFV